MILEDQFSDINKNSSVKIYNSYSNQMKDAIFLLSQTLQHTVGRHKAFTATMCSLTQWQTKFLQYVNYLLKFALNTELC